MKKVENIFAEHNANLLTYFIYYSEKVERWNGGKVPWNKSTKLYTTSSRAWPVIQSCETTSPTQKQAANPEPPIIPIRGNLRLLSAYICVNRMTRDPVF